MVGESDSEIVLLLNILQEPDGDKAQRMYRDAFDLPELKDQSVYELIEERVFDVIMRKAAVVELDRELALAMLLLLKRGLKRSKGGQRKTRQEILRKRALVGLAREIKARLVSAGMSATEAHLRAAEEAADEGKRHGVHFSVSYIEREMQKTKE
jgi:hypothetical protein